MESLPVEIKFAQNLAGNETKTRLKAVKKLKKYLRVKSASKKDGFSCEDFLKLWKGLHYCMWMQDKPLLQEELSTTLTHLVHDLSTLEAQMLFIKVFFITEAREWNSIDIWRLDKFMMMVRNMLYEALMIVKKLKWDKNKLEGFTHMIYDTILNPDSDSIPDGLKIHFCDIYLDEVEKAGGSQLTGSQLLQLLDPFIKYLQKAKNATILKRVMSCVFDPVVTRIADEVKVKQTQNDTDDTPETVDVPLLTLKFDGKLISDHIFRVSQEDCVLGRNRPMLYGIVKKLQDIQEGVLPQQKEIVIPEGVTNQDVREAVNSLMNIDGKKDQKKKLRKKKNKKEKQNDDSGVNENADPNNNSDGRNNTEPNQMPSASSAGGKRKHSAAEDGESLTKIKKKKLESESISEDNVTDKTALKKLKNKLKFDVIKGKKGKKFQIEKKTETATHSKKKEKSNSINEPVLETTSVPVKKTETSKTATKEIAVSAEIPSSFKKTSDTLTKNGKRTHSQSKSDNRSANNVSDLSSGKVPEIKVQEATPAVKSQASTVTPQTSTVKSPANDELQDGEIEIWVPNKKYKGSKDATTPKSNFAAFDHSKPPVAFVKRSLSKSLKKTPSSLKTPGSGSKTGSAKRVSFDMKKNQAQGFKESLNSPMTPFNPSKKPDSGILKSPAPSSIQGLNKGAAKNSNNDLETPVTRQAAVKGASKKKSMGTPVASLGFQKKKATAMKRQRAADFFL